jgi:hypothetical protein
MFPGIEITYEAHNADSLSGIDGAMISGMCGHRRFNTDAQSVW